MTFKHEITKSHLTTSKIAIRKFSAIFEVIELTVV